jgi:hypothetical protein
MTAKQALDAAIETEVNRSEKRQLRHETICGPRGACHREALNGPGHWSWCPDCFTVYDDSGPAVNRIREMQ